MNPFESTIENNSYTLKENNLIEVWIQERGRKVDTFISGLPLTDQELSEHLRNIKKSKACNGSIKKVVKDEICKN